MRQARTLALGAMLCALAGACQGHRAEPATLTVACAASLRVVMPDLIAGFGGGIDPSYGASGELRRQVEAGAPVDAVIFASGEPVDQLVAEGHATAASRKVLASNQLVLIVPHGKPRLTFASLTDIPAGERLAIGEPSTVPAGQYARDSLTKLGKWDALKDRLVMGGDVAAVLAYARRGEVAAAIVYRTDTIGIADIDVVDVALGDWAPHPLVVAALTTTGATGDRGARAQAFLAYLASPAAQKILADKGFGPP